MLLRLTSRRVLSALLTGLLSTAFITCSGDDGKSSGDGDVQDPQIAFAVSHALPFTAVEVTGMPANTGTLVGIATSLTGQKTDTWVERKSDGKLYLTVPLNTDEPVGGGDVSVQITNGSNITSEAATLTIDPLPDAPGAFAQLVTTLQNLLTAWLRVHGTTRETLRAADVTTLQDHFIPLLVAHDIIDNPDNPNSLRRFADGPIPFFDNEAVDYDLADRIVAQTGLQALFEEQIASVDSLTVLPPLRAADLTRLQDNLIPLLVAHEIIDNSDNPNSLITFADRPIPFRGNEAADYDLADRIVAQTGLQARFEERNARTGRLTVLPHPSSLGFLSTQGANPTIGSAAELSHYMTVAQRANRVTSGLSGQVLNDAGFYMGMAALVPPATVVATGIGLMLWGYQKINEGAGGLLPSRFSGTECLVDPVLFEEDKPGPGSWVFKVDASSSGWKLDKLALEAVVQYVGLRGTGTGDFIANHTQMGDDLAGWVTTEVVNRALNATPQSGVFEVPPYTWPGIDLTGEPWSVGRLTYGTAFSVNSSLTTFDPEEVGTATLNLVTGSGLYGGITTFCRTDIQVAAIEVIVTPSNVVAETDQEVEFTLEVRNAVDKTVLWVVEPPGTPVSTTTEGITVKAPSDEWDPPFKVIASSLASGGIRGKPGAPERRGTATVSHDAGEVIVLPPGACVPPDSMQLFDASIIGLEDQSVTWSATSQTGPAGFFRGNGYTAPPQDNPLVQIIATSVANPTLKGYARVTVSDCTCWWTSDQGESGSVARYMFTPLYAFEFNVSPTDVDPPNWAIQIIDPVGPSEFGEFRASVTYITPTGRIYLSMEDQELGIELPRINITRVSDTQIDGFVSGKLLYMIDPYPPAQVDVLSFDLAFSAALATPGDMFPCDPNGGPN